MWPLVYEVSGFQIAPHWRMALCIRWPNQPGPIVLSCSACAMTCETRSHDETTSRKCRRCRNKNMLQLLHRVAPAKSGIFDEAFGDIPEEFQSYFALRFVSCFSHLSTASSNFNRVSVLRCVEAFFVSTICRFQCFIVFQCWFLPVPIPGGKFSTGSAQWFEWLSPLLCLDKLGIAFPFFV